MIMHEESVNYFECPVHYFAFPNTDFYAYPTPKKAFFFLNRILSLTPVPSENLILTHFELKSEASHTQKIKI